jgi:hypothetical protein
MTGFETLQTVLESEIYKEWTKGLQVVDVSFNPQGRNVIAVVKEDDGVIYHACRFFILGSKVHVSLDAENITADAAIQYVMKNYGIY